MENYEKRGYLNSSFKMFHLTDTEIKEYDYHYHDFNKLIIFLKGNVSYSIEGKNYSLKPYDLVLVKSGEVHKPTILTNSPYERIVIYISSEFIKAYQKKDYDLGMCFKKASEERTHVLRVPSFEKTQLFQTTKELEASFGETAYANQLYQQILFIEFMVHLNRTVLSEHVLYIETKSYNEKISQVLDYIANHLTEDMSMESLAGIFFMNKFYLMHLFKEETGYTLANYINNKRLLYARELMERQIMADKTLSMDNLDSIEKQTSITDVCYACGFKNYSSFSRAYKKCFQDTPRNYQLQLLSSIQDEKKLSDSHNG